MKPLTETTLKNIISNRETDNEAELAEITTESLQQVKQRSVKGVLSYSIRSFWLYGMALVAAAVLSAFLTEAEFGVYYLVTAVIGLFTFLSDIGLAASLVQKKESPTVPEMRTTFTVQQVLSLVIAGILVALTPYWRGRGFGTAELALLYALASSFFLASLKTIPSILLERELRFDQIVIPGIVENTIFHGTTIILAWQGWGITSYTVAVVLRGLAGVITMYAIKRWPFGFGFDWSAFRHLLRFGAKFQLNDLLARIKDDLFIVVLGSFLPLNQLGYIAWARRWVTFPQQFSVNNVMAVTFPTFARLQHDKERLARALHKTLYFITLLILPLLAGMSLFLFPILQLVPQYTKWTPAVWSFVFFAVNIAWGSISTPLTNTLNAIGEINKTLKLMIMWTVLTWTISPIAVWLIGFNGVAVASALIGFSSVATIYLLRQVVPFRVWPAIWRQLAATSAMIAVGLIGWSFWSRSFLYLGSGMLLTSGVYTLAFLLVGWKSLKSELQSLGIWR